MIGAVSDVEEQTGAVNGRALRRLLPPLLPPHPLRLRPRARLRRHRCAEGGVVVSAEAAAEVAAEVAAAAADSCDGRGRTIKIVIAGAADGAVARPPPVGGAHRRPLRKTRLRRRGVEEVVEVAATGTGPPRKVQKEGTNHAKMRRDQTREMILGGALRS